MSAVTTTNNTQRSLIIIPTYNEAENIGPLLSRIFHEVPDVCVLFVDDNSQDGTVDKIRHEMKTRPNQVHILSRPGKLGLGSAYVAGFKWGLERGFDKLIEMDADMSHPATSLPELIKSLDHYDVAVGSRYVAGGGTDNWSFIRKMISMAGSFYGRTVLGISVRDLTGGFNGWRRKVLETINIDTLVGGGYVFQVELKYRALLAGFSLVEFPIIFVERIYGTSKMSINIVIEAAFKVIFLRLRRKALMAPR